MKQRVEELLKNVLAQLVKTNNISVDIALPVKVDRPKDNNHGDFSSNIALVLAKSLRRSPMQVAQLIVDTLKPDSAIQRVDIAKPGFINFFLNTNVTLAIIPTVLKTKNNYGQSNFGQGKKILIEFVSANPTGPLHVGHGRGAAFGASLANILTAAGFNVSTEYYVNDAGRQMAILAVSVWLRYLTQLGVEIVFPVNGYRGDYVKDIAKTIVEQQKQAYIHPWAKISENLPLDETLGGDKDVYIDALISQSKLLLGADGFNVFHRYALEAVLVDIRADLSEFGVDFDQWFSEQSLLDCDAIASGITALTAAGQTYTKAQALWFKATNFGDEKDRVLVRANGQTTYFASDVAYHWHKYQRKFQRVINIFGADHHGYVTRLKSAVKALGYNEQAIDVFLVQFAILYRQGIRVQMSTRSGSFVTLRELRHDVGNDAARFFYVMRKPEQHMDFDLDLAKSQSNDNPVYYIQYAYARISSVMRQLQERNLNWDEAVGLAQVGLLTDPHEQALQVMLSRYPEVIESAAMMCEPHQLAYYLKELASNLHSYYNAIKLLCEQETLRCARLCLLLAIAQVLKNGLRLLGVSAPETM